jgi:hypothetical protein
VVQPLLCQYSTAVFTKFYQQFLFSLISLEQIYFFRTCTLRHDPCSYGIYDSHELQSIVDNIDTIGIAVLLDVAELAHPPTRAYAPLSRYAPEYRRICDMQVGTPSHNTVLSG